mmetsp:Transcript_46215/g.142521  ORF Transcript_46215/g.142521 Transcript_46215/m.142521 type:complete len:266 (+) Transcript_46215:1127-1924(+)
MSSLSPAFFKLTVGLQQTFFTHLHDACQIRLLTVDGGNLDLGFPRELLCFQLLRLQLRPHQGIRAMKVCDFAVQHVPGLRFDRFANRSNFLVAPPFEHRVRFLRRTVTSRLFNFLQTMRQAHRCGLLKGRSETAVLLVDLRKLLLETIDRSTNRCLNSGVLEPEMRGAAPSPYEITEHTFVLQVRRTHHFFELVVRGPIARGQIGLGTKDAVRISAIGGAKVLFYDRVREACVQSTVSGRVRETATLVRGRSPSKNRRSKVSFHR